MRLRNPILPGFHPDPSVCRVGDDFYLVNSSFEYFPGVPIHHSRDLVNWRQIGNCLTRQSQLPLNGVKASDGIYAPTIRFHNGRYYMVTTNIQGGGNFYVWTEDPAGEWSEPIWLKQGGIDPSLFFEDGRVYLTTNGTAWSAIRGIYQCEIDPETGKQLTDTRFLWAGTGGSYPEGPHLYRRGDYYYLTAAEGGTAECHMVTIARSRSPWGPFESFPSNPIITHRSLMGPIQATGHADLFEDQHGGWWAVFLGYRYGEYGWHHLGRETYLAPVEWTPDGWPVVNGGRVLQEISELERPFAASPDPATGWDEHFDDPTLSSSWCFLRNPVADDYSLTERPGWLRLRCSAASPGDLASPSLVCRRQEQFDCTYRTTLEFSPEHENEEAGLILLIDNAHHCEVFVTRRGGARVVATRRRIGTLWREESQVAVETGPVTLEFQVSRTAVKLGVAETKEFRLLATHETRYLSTQVAGGYTGTMVGLYATGNGTASATNAHFDRLLCEL